MLKLFQSIALILVIAVSWQSPAKAEIADGKLNEFIVLPDAHSGNLPEILKVTGEQIGLLGPASNLTILDADGETIASFNIPDKGRYRQFEYIENDFGAELVALEAYLGRLQTTQAPGPLEVQIDIPEIADRISEARVMQTGSAKVLLIGSPLLIFPDDPSASMINRDGKVVIASDGLLSGSRLLSAYGVSNDTNGLSGVSVHYCAIFPENVPIYERGQVARQWAHYFGLRGGEVAHFSKGMNGCVESFSSDVSGAIEVTPFQKDAVSAMILAARSADIAEIAVDDRSDLEDQISRDRLTNEVAVRETTAKLDQTNNLLETSVSDLDTCRENTVELKGVVTELEAKIDEFDKVFAEDDNLATLTTFTKFESVRHPTLKDQFVTTGTEFTADNFPIHESAFCYLIRVGQDGVQIRIDIGDQSRGGTVKWDSQSSDVLRAASLSSSDFRKARSSCRFPGDR